MHTFINEYGDTHLRSMHLTVGKVLFLFSFFTSIKSGRGRDRKRKGKSGKGAFQGVDAMLSILILSSPGSYGSAIHRLRVQQTGL